MWSFKFCLKLLRRVVSWELPACYLVMQNDMEPSKEAIPLEALRSRTGPRQSRTVSPSVTPSEARGGASGCREMMKLSEENRLWGWVPAWPHCAAASAPLSPLAWMLGAGVPGLLPHSLVQPPPGPGIIGCSSRVQVPARAPVVRAGHQVWVRIKMYLVT